jgi:hypothetical protein
MTAAKSLSPARPAGVETGYLSRVNLGTLCPHCGTLCTWYRSDEELLGVCPDHGQVNQFALPARRRG